MIGKTDRQKKCSRNLVLKSARKLILFDFISFHRFVICYLLA
jgi:hypothetical protein